MIQYLQGGRSLIGQAMAMPQLTSTEAWRALTAARDNIDIAVINYPDPVAAVRDAGLAAGKILEALHGLSHPADVGPSAPSENLVEAVKLLDSSIGAAETPLIECR